MDDRKTLLLVLGNQLFKTAHLEPNRDGTVFMAEDMGLCTYVRHHQQKIVLFLAAMRGYRDELEAAGFDVHYHSLDPDDDETYEARLQRVIRERGIERVVHFEIEDKPAENRIIAALQESGVDRVELESPMFVCDREQFRQYNDGTKRPFMATFYKQERRRHGILVDSEGEPVGGQWSFDEDNRKKLPKSVTPPDIPGAGKAPHVDDVIAVVESTFEGHPGSARDFWWPTTRHQARAWLEEFLSSRLELFGPYEDAMTTRSDTLFHSVLSPLLNLGLLTPREVVDAALEHAESNEVPLQSLEGFVRQVIGWREFIRGIYREYSEQQESQNFFGHTREMAPSWYDGTTGIPPLDHAIDTARKLGWTHHIPRLMVLGNLMTLCEIRPASAHTWFMEMYVDSSEWVMGPNVYGMGLFSDGGIFATKPYICGSNYLKKMSDYPQGDWCDVVDGLYWRFIDKHRDFFASNPRLALMPRALDRLKEERRKTIFAAAEAFLEQHTIAAG